MKLNIFSGLRKPGLVPGKSLSLAQNYVFCFGENLNLQNKLRFPTRLDHLLFKDGCQIAVSTDAGHTVHEAS